MIPFRNVFTEYAVIQGKRVTEKQKINFLLTLKKEFTQASYQTEIQQEQIKALGEVTNYYNLYVGNIEKADVVIATYYDTPVHEIGVKQYSPLVTKKPSLFNALLPSILISVLALAIFYFGLYPFVKEQQLLSWSGLLTLLLFWIAFVLIRRYRLGIPRRENFVRNTASVLIAREFTLCSLGNSKVAVAFLDAGTTNHYGERMLKSTLKKSAKVIFLDTAGSREQTHIFGKGKLKNNYAEVFLHTQSNATLPFGDILLTSGEYVDGKIEVDLEVAEFEFDVLEKRIRRVVEVLVELSGIDR